MLDWFGLGPFFEVLARRGIKGSKGAEIGRTTIQAETVHWVETGSTFVVKAWETQESVSDGWSAQLWGAIMGYEDYRSLDHLEAEISMALVLTGRGVQGG